ncbi:uncharacterized protein PV07_12799, partial [Cladophialophora immunda]
MVYHRLVSELENLAQPLVCPSSESSEPLYSGDRDRSWALLFSDSSLERWSEYEKIGCPTYSKSTSEPIQDSTLNLSGNPIPLPTGSRDHEPSTKWMARCFAASIYLRRDDQTLSQQSLADADAEFEKMLTPQQDPKVLLALNQTLQILHMHDQGDITRGIMQSAYLVAERLLEPGHPLRTIVRWMVYVANGQMRNHDITSETLAGVHEHFVQHYGDKDAQSIASKYCYGFMLNVESRYQEAEQVLREVYKNSVTVLGPKHLQSISASTNLHRALERQGRIEDAILVLRGAIRYLKDTLGDNHPRTLESLRLLGGLCQKQGHLDQTEELFWQVLKGRAEMLGPDHPFTLGMRSDLEELLKGRGKW